MSDIFREIDEELRRDNLLKLWLRYWPYIVGVVAFALLAAGGYVVWRDHQLSQRQAQSTRYAVALGLVSQGKGEEATKLFQSLAAEGGGYAMLARFEAAGLMAKAGDRKGAIAAYRAIAASSALPDSYRDLATLLAAMQELPQGQAKAVIDRLKPLTAKDNPWRPTAIELTALARLKAGDKTAALKLYQNLADDHRAPLDLRARAAQMAAALSP